MLQGSEQKTQESSTSIAVEHDSLQKMKMHTHCTVIISTVLADCQMSTTFCLPHLKSSKLSSLADDAAWSGSSPRTVNLVAPCCCLSPPNTSPSRSANQQTNNPSRIRRIAARERISRLCDLLRCARGWYPRCALLPNQSINQSINHFPKVRLATAACLEHSQHAS